MIEKTVQLAATPARVFHVLTNSKDFSEMSGGAPAEITPESGAAFALFGGMIEGRNVECIESVRLVQAWRPKTWEKGSYSLVAFELSESEGGTELRLTHSAYPAEQQEHLGSGWDKNYLEPLVRLLSRP